MERIEILKEEVNDWWNELPNQVKDEIDIAIIALDSGNIVPYEEVKKCIQNGLRNKLDEVFH